MATAFQENPQRLADELANLLLELGGNRRPLISLEFLTATIRAYGPMLFDAAAKGHSLELMQKSLRPHLARISRDIPADATVSLESGVRMAVLGEKAFEVLRDLCPPSPDYR